MPIAGGLAAIALAISLLTSKSISGNASVDGTLHTTTVHRARVQATVTATGKVAPAAALSVNFAASGVITEVDVKVGDQVRAGQTLAKIDDTQTKAALAAAQVALTSAENHMARLQERTTPIVATQNAVASAQQQVAAAQSVLDAAVQGAATNAVGNQDGINQVHTQLSRDLDQYSNDQATCSATPGADAEGGTSCATVLAQDQSAIATDNEALVIASQQQESSQLQDEQSIQEARNIWLSARDNLASALAAGNNKPAASSTMAAARTRVIQAQADLSTAQKKEADTILIAPSDGTVAVVNGVAGQTVSAGDTVAIATSGSPSTDASSGASTPSAFLILDNESALQVVVEFADPDAKRFQVGQSATISLSALPNQPVAGRVSTIDANSAVVGRVIMRSVVVTLIDPPAALKAGMIAKVSVVARVRDNVLAVPTADVTVTGGTWSVVLVRNGRQILVEVSTGLVGDHSTEITSGLYAGERIVDATTGGPRPPRALKRAPGPQ